jgi:peptidyl-prolyl cis-trans isomerase SurA
MLKQLILTVLAIIFIINVQAQSDSDVLMTVGDDKVTVGEFRYIYEKNNGKTADYSEASLEEYVNLYTKFKLKVAKARDMKLDTIVSLQKELEGYRTQLANSFLTDREVVDKLITEIVDRKKQDVRISHILVKVNAKGPNNLQEKAIKKLLNLKQQLKEGKTFEYLAKEYSDDKNTKDNGGDLGFITASLPDGFYELENAMYDLDINEVSDPIKTKLGFHIVKVVDKREARGMIEVAHIFKKVDKVKKVNINATKKTMDSIYVALQGGASFDKMASKHSDDKNTKTKGGVLPAFGIAVFDSKFEDAAFGLKNEGDITAPILTSVGYHIIKKIGTPKPQTLAQVKLQFKDKIVKYDRYESSQKKMIEKIKSTSQFREKRNALAKFTKTLDETFYSYKWQPSKLLGDDILLAFGPNQDESVKDFAKYAKKQTRLRSQFDKSKPLSEAVEVVYNEFVKERAYAYEQANLENKYPEFKSLMREYREGILLFEATKINVWDKANTDTVGLYSFYEQNKSMYIFEEQATIGKYIVNTNDEKKVKKIMKCAKKHNSEKTLKRFNKDGVEMLEYSEITVEPGSKELIGLDFKKKSISQPLYDKNSKKTLFKKVVKINPSRRKSLKEARGYVVADYQDQLEMQWIIDLKKQYPVKINDSVYNALKK